MRVLLIINPKAGVKKANRFLTDIVALFNARGWICTVFTTMAQGDGTRIARTYGCEADLTVCIGGDGTLNEVLTGLRECGSVSQIGYIPAGSTNDFAASLKLPANVMAAARRIADGAERLLDAGEFNGRSFTYVASFGAFTDIAYSTPQDEKNALGRLAYLLEGIRELGEIRPVQMSFEADGQVFSGNYLFGAVTNSLRIAGLINLDKKRVDMSDGLLEVMLIREPKTGLELAEIVHALNTGVYNVPEMTFFSAAEVRVHSDGKTPWTLDGEYAAGEKDILIRNVHGGLKLRC